MKRNILFILLIKLAFMPSFSLRGQTEYFSQTFENLQKSKEESLKSNDFTKAADIKKELDKRDAEEKKIALLQIDLNNKIQSEDFIGAELIQNELKLLKNNMSKKEELRNKITLAIKNEDFENAAKFKSELNTLIVSNELPIQQNQILKTEIKPSSSDTVKVKQVLFISNDRFNTWENIFLYAGDKLKFEFTGQNKKADINLTNPPIDNVKRNKNGWESSPDLTLTEYEFKMDGPHTIDLVVKSKGELKLIRIPAIGKENASTKYIPKTETISPILPGERNIASPISYNKNTSLPTITQNGIPIGKIRFDREYASEKEVCSIFNTQNLQIATVTILNANSLTEYMVTIKVDVLDVSKHVKTSKTFSEMKGNTSDYLMIGLQWLVSNKYL